MGGDGPAEFGALLRRYRRRAGLTQEELAEQAGISTRALSDLERGVRRRPHKDTVALLAGALALAAWPVRVRLPAFTPPDGQHRTRADRNGQRSGELNQRGRGAMVSPLHRRGARCRTGNASGLRGPLVLHSRTRLWD